ncbi:MAG: hypothetical protein FJ033_11705 [Chloroflexi bacterium]|nr:hypothetical protein [Chloroflexota bacterium]
MIKSTTSRTVGVSYPNTALGYGRLDVAALVEQASTFTTATSTSTPTDTRTGTLVPTVTPTPTPSPTLSATPTSTGSLTATPPIVLTRTFTPTATNVPRADATRTSTPTPLAITAGVAPTLRPAQVTITGGGGTLTTDRQALIVAVPPGGLREGDTLAFEPVARLSATMPLGTRLLRSFELDSPTPPFVPVTLRFTVDYEVLADAPWGQIRLFRLRDSSGWREEIPLRIVPAAGQFEAVITQFSSFEIAMIDYRQILPVTTLNVRP